MTVNERRKITLAEITRSPVTVVISRKIKTDNGKGGWSTTEQVLPPQACRLHVVATRATDTSTEGGQQERSQWGLLCAWDADIKHGTEVADTFTLPGRGTFKVLRVNPVLYLGQVVSKQVLLEEIL